MYYLTITPRWVCVEYSTHIGTQNSNDDQSRGYVPGTMQLLCLPQRAKYTSSTRFILVPAAWIAWDTVYNIVSVNGVWMRLINLSCGQDRHGALIATR